MSPGITPAAATPQLVPSDGTEYTDENYKKLKRKLRDIMTTNETMLKEYEDTKKKIKTLAYERNLLLDNIARLEHGGSSDDDSIEFNSDMSMSEDDHDVASAPPKRSKITKVPSKTRRVQPIERDDDGHPKLPQQIGVLTVLKLGSIVTDRDTFHNERYIFPVGYTVSRTYPSMKDPAANTVITSTITDGGDGPRFHVVAEDMPEEPIIANSATGAWTVVVRRTNEIRQREHSNSASGPDYYGFKHPTIAKMIQDLPGTKDLEHYVWQNFEEMEPRAAKGVMAAAEKKRGNLEQMGSANRRGPKGRSKLANDDSATASTSADNANHDDADSVLTPTAADDDTSMASVHPASQDPMDEDNDSIDPTAIDASAYDELADSEGEEVDELGASD
ncbi:FYRN-domain-containing protein [Hesseltinella vesiculosa]|uniref:FYRN-domain-containing protein n=1 Tax=Hesseltinella vesiculosa TaxID=101127 RepID=A0A1X2G7N4_9FUNG|nr:FYRN-domain-containing protein [Hesseltinella vesiculosa]